MVWQPSNSESGPKSLYSSNGVGGELFFLRFFLVFFPIYRSQMDCLGFPALLSLTRLYLFGRSLSLYFICVWIFPRTFHVAKRIHLRMAWTNGAVNGIVMTYPIGKQLFTQERIPLCGSNAIKVVNLRFIAGFESRRGFWWISFGRKILLSSFLTVDFTLKFHG